MKGKQLREEDGFAFEGDVEFGVDGGDDFGLQGFDVGEGGVAAVDESQGVAGGDACGGAGEDDCDSEPRGGERAPGLKPAFFCGLSTGG